MVIESGTGVSKEEIEGRLARARERMRSQGLGILLVIGRSFYDRMGSLAYLTNHFPPFPPGAFSEKVRGMGHGLLVLPLEAEPVLFVDHRNFRREMVHIPDVRPESNISLACANQLKRLGAEKSRVGIAGEDIMPATMYRDLTGALPEAKFENANELVDGLRASKSPAEVDYLRGAARIVEAGYAAIFAAIRPGARESDLCAEGHAAGMRAGADFVRYVRVHSGPWASWGSRWPQATQRRLEPGDVIRFDYVGAFEGYGFDVNRTAVVPGKKLDPKVEAMIELCAAATEAAVATVRAGASAADVHRAASHFLDQNAGGAGRYLYPMAGHGIGLETVEAPLIQPDNGARLAPGMVLCVEPTFNLPEVGGANVEQMVLVQEGGCEVLTKTPTRPWRK
ncbi:MAG: aminopeptidase P family protein [Candidatus Tectomicrobia bacterium]|uniref:Aminopeptidase P family protein n=1 Tax=Tectimicrobiota bacterium TaxID=2528274 RepID=A0A932HX49_UNCTE|nr:aminopeptidase P family protein [Candidatus Tectomicrobia bacterium]